MGAFVIGIGGGSASGKSTLAAGLQARLAPHHVEIINQDRYFFAADLLPKHASPDGGREWPDYNQPGTVDWPRLRTDLRAAREGEAEIVLLEGILVLYDAELRELMDLRLFVAAEPDERILRRLRRNLARGGNLDDICDYYLDSVRFRHREFCEPTRAHADVVIPGGTYEAEARETALREVEAKVRDRLAGRG